MTKRAGRRGRTAVLGAAPPPYFYSRLRLVGVALICARVALVPVVFEQTSDLPFSVPKSLLSHGLAYALAGVIAGLVIQFGRSFLVRSWLHVPVFGFLLANIAATLFAADSLLALYGTHDRMVGLATIADGVILYFGIVLIVRTRRDGVAAAAALITGSVVVLTYEAIQFVGKDPFSWSVDGSVRPFSTIGQTTNLAEYLTVLALGTAAIALFDGALRAQTRAALLLYSLLVLAGIVATQTRSALIGLLAGGCLLVALTWAAHPSRRARVVSLFGAIGAGIVLSAVLFLTPFGARVLSTVELSATAESDASPSLEQSAEVRVALYRMALEMVRDRPIFGYGPDNILAAVPRYRSEHEPFEVQESPNTSAHGWVAQVAATGGLVGLFAYVAIAATAVWLTVRSGFHPAAWAALAMLVAFLGAGVTTVNAVSTDWLFWGAVGGVASVTASRRSPDTVDVGRTRRRHGGDALPTRGTTRHLVGVAAAGVGVILALTTITAFDASRSSRASQVARLQGRSAQAIDLGLRATQSDPRRARYWDTLGLAYVSADRLTDAATAFEQAMHIAPYDVRYHGDLARTYLVLFQRGNRALGARATQVGETAVSVDPNNPLANYTRAIVMQVTGNLPEAVRSVERAMALDQTNSPAMFLTATQVYLASGRPSDAIATARSAIAVIGPPNTVAIRVELARALVADGQPAAAVKELDAALAIKPNDPAAVQLRAQIVAGLRG